MSELRDSPPTRQLLAAVTQEMEDAARDIIRAGLEKVSSVDLVVTFRDGTQRALHSHLKADARALEGDGNG